MKTIGFKKYLAKLGYGVVKVWENESGLYAQIKGFASKGTSGVTQVLQGGTIVRLSHKDVQNPLIVGTNTHVILESDSRQDVHIRNIIRNILRELSEEDLEEITTTSNIAGYNTPNAFKKSDGTDTEDEPDAEYVKRINTVTGYTTISEQSIRTNALILMKHTSPRDGKLYKSIYKVIDTDRKLASYGTAWGSGSGIHLELIKTNDPGIKIGHYQEMTVSSLKKLISSGIAKVVKTLNLEESVKRGARYGDWLVTQYTPISYDDLGSVSGGIIKLVNQSDFTTLLIQHDNALRGSQWWVSTKGREVQNSKPEVVIQKAIKLHEGVNRYHQLRKDESTPNQKIGIGIRNIRKQLSEMEKFVTWYSKIKVESDLDSADYWKRTQRHLGKIRERLQSLSEKINKL